MGYLVFFGFSFFSFNHVFFLNVFRFSKFFPDVTSKVGSEESKCREGLRVTYESEIEVMGWGSFFRERLHSLKLTFSHLKMVVSKFGISFSRGLFSGAFAVSFREGTLSPIIMVQWKITLNLGGGFIHIFSFHPETLGR